MSSIQENKKERIIYIYCTKETPFSEENLPENWQCIHNDAEETPASIELDCSTAFYRCPNCGIEFSIYLGD